jgi:hypothetical protein
MPAEIHRLIVLMQGNYNPGEYIEKQPFGFGPDCLPMHEVNNTLHVIG